MFQKLFSIQLPASSTPQGRYHPDVRLPLGVSVNFGVDSSSPDLLIHEFQEDVLEIANHSYETDSSSPTLNSGRHNQSLLDNFLRHFLPALSAVDKTQAILEIGCGEGKVVRYLAEQGFEDVTACEMADFPFQESLGGVKLIRDYFRPGLFTDGQFDLILSKTVFEHIPQISDTFEHVRRALKPGGVLFFSVPSCESELQLGDPRTLAVAHWNYFTKSNLRHLLISTGFDVVTICEGQGDLFVMCRKVDRRAVESNGQAADPLLIRYAEKLTTNLGVLQRRINSLKQNHGSAAIYGLDFNLPFVLDWTGVELRMVDSDPAKWGMLYCNNPEARICNPESLVQEPVSEVWVAPITYDTEIRCYLKGLLDAGKTEVVSLKELYEATAREGAVPSQS